MVGRIERLCDTVIRLESFAGSDKATNPIYKEYNGRSNGLVNIDIELTVSGLELSPSKTILAVKMSIQR